MSPEAANQLIGKAATPANVGVPTPWSNAGVALALAALCMLVWSTLAVSVVSVSTLSPLLTTGVGLAGGGLIGLPWLRWRTLRMRSLAVGSVAMFGYHALYFWSLQIADPVAANLLHYLWPLLIVLFAPALLSGFQLARRHVVAAVFGFGGAAACVGPIGTIVPRSAAGLGMALLSAAIWAYYSVWSRRFPEVPTASVAIYCLVSGVGSLAAYIALGANPHLDPLGLGGTLAAPSSSQWVTLCYLAIGPLGGAFYLWDRAMKTGNPQQIALLAYAVPVVSTMFVGLYVGEDLQASTLVGAALVTVAVAIGGRPATRIKTDEPLREGESSNGPPAHRDR